MSAIKEAVMKAIAKTWKDEKFPIGHEAFRGQVILDLDIDVKRGEDVEAIPSSKVNWYKVVASLLKKLDRRQRAKFKKLIIDTANESLADETPIEELMGEDKEEIEDLQRSIGRKLEKVKRAGPTRVSGVVRITKLLPLQGEPIILDPQA